MLDDLSGHSQRVGLKMDKDKTKIMSKFDFVHRSTLVEIGDYALSCCRLYLPGINCFDRSNFEKKVNSQIRLDWTTTNELFQDKRVWLVCVGTDNLRY